MRGCSFPPGLGELFGPINISSPAAGADFTYTFHSTHIVLLDMVRFRLVTDATVATRMVAWRIGGAWGPYTLAYTTGLGASAAMSYLSWRQGIQNDVTFNGWARHSIAPIYVPAGAVLESFVGSLQAADQLDQIYVQGRRWRTL